MPRHSPISRTMKTGEPDALTRPSLRVSQCDPRSSPPILVHRFSSTSLRYFQKLSTDEIWQTVEIEQNWTDRRPPVLPQSDYDNENNSRVS
jgi:hypothetical protein